MADRKLDIFELLRATDKCDGEWFSKQSPEAQKEFAPLVAMRWAATITDGPHAPVMLWSINERVNLHLFDLQKHPELVYRLMASCGLGGSLRHQWLPGHKRKAEGNKAYAFLQDRYPDANDRELEFLMSKFTKKSFSEYLGDCGIQAEAAKDILKAYDKLKKD